MSSIDDRYKAALIEEHDGYVRSGRAGDAKGVAKVLKDQYGHDIAKQDEDDGGEDKPKLASTLPESTAAEKAPENTAEPKPRRVGRPKQSQGEDK
jgi:hypothetical protein